jgi:biopolymer transport protein ExbD
MKLSRANKKVVQPGMIPLMDVMFNVMAAFLFSIHGLKSVQSLPLNLPSAARAEKNIKKSFDISINPAGEIFVMGQPVSVAELQAQLQVVLADDPAQHVLLRGDEASPYGVVVSVLDILQGNNVQDLSLETNLKK